MLISPVRQSWRRQAIGAFAMALLAVITAGCQRGDDGPDTFPVTGLVTLGGNPVSEATVTFAPSAPTGLGAQARTDAEGKFDVSVMLDMGKRTKRGLPVGEYGVSVIKLQLGAGAASLSTAPKNVLPAKFADPKSSGLKATVRADQPNLVELPLVD